MPFYCGGDESDVVAGAYTEEHVYIRTRTWTYGLADRVIQPVVIWIEADEIEVYITADEGLYPYKALY